MVRIYGIEGGTLRPLGTGLGSGLPNGAVWIDLVAPTEEETEALQRSLGLTLPSLESVSGIQPSGRLVAQDGTLFATAIVPAGEQASPPSCR